MRPIITLLTDFGTADGYVAEMKGVLLSHVPEAALVDVSHEVAPQDVEGARLALARYWRRFPPGTVHVCVVDPGVGTGRAALAVASQGRYLVGPDNGLLSPALLMQGTRVVTLPAAPGVAPTFHGRDLFAPAAAQLATGTALDDLGHPTSDPVVRRTPEARRLADGSIEGTVITVDRFGNAITNLLATGAVAQGMGAAVEVGGQALPVRRVYADVAPGEAIVLPGSNGLLEIAVRDGSAAARLALTRGSLVRLRVPT
ncbi:MAG TPA: SAM-dependent chlorinase/fluorinase [Gemmatirosa sp.]|nr:SAM-dependent chlorinase/fluorinase [Gemmatirosa sp.]